MTKHIFVTGGVVGSLGKGLTSAAIGMILERRNLKVSVQKLALSDTGKQLPLLHSLSLKQAAPVSPAAAPGIARHFGNTAPSPGSYTARNKFVSTRSCHSWNSWCHWS